jgi:hypothetical protein
MENKGVYLFGLGRLKGEKKWKLRFVMWLGNHESLLANWCV